MKHSITQPKKKERKQYLNQFHSTIYIRSHNNQTVLPKKSVTI